MSVEVNVPKEMEINADRDLMRVVFQNLVGNAIKYGRNEGRIRIRSTETDDCWEFHIWNQGVGGPEDKRDLLFTEFGRVQDPRLAAEKGTDLGLFITRDILKRHGGSVGLACEEGRWIDFSITLPKQPSA